jgi:hypothetical protein
MQKSGPSAAAGSRTLGNGRKRSPGLARRDASFRDRAGVRPQTPSHEKQPSGRRDADHMAAAGLHQSEPAP